MAAWQGLDGFEGRASVRTWLYRIATNRCLNAVRRRAAARQGAGHPRGRPPEPTRLGEVVWLEPYPTCSRGPDAAPLGPRPATSGPKSISLAFVTALQVLPPASSPCSCCATCSASTRVRWPRCSTRPSNRSTARSSGPAPGAASTPPASSATAPRARFARRARARRGFVRVYDPADSTRWSRCSPTTSSCRCRRSRSNTRARRRRPLLRRHPRAGPALRSCPRPRPTVNRRSEPTSTPHRHPPRDRPVVIALTGDRICALIRFENSVLPWFGLPRSLPGS